MSTKENEDKKMSNTGQPEAEDSQISEEEYNRITEETKKLKIDESPPPTPEEEPTENEHIEPEEETQSPQEEQEIEEESRRLAEEATLTLEEQELKDAIDENDRLEQDYYDEILRDAGYEEWCKEEETFNIPEEEQAEIDNQPFEEPERTFITEHIKFLEQITDADAEFIEATAIQTFATLLFNFKIQETTAVSYRKFFKKTKNLAKSDGKPLNLWTIVFGESRKARKTTVMNKTEDLFLNMGIEYNVKILTPKSMTPQSLASLSKGVKVNER